MSINKLIENLITTNFTLLKNTEVIKWLFGDLSHISTNKDKKKKEDEWGKSILKIKRPDLKLNCQWTNKFGEHLAEEILQFCGEKNIKKPKKIKNYQPDLETDNFIVEVKTQTFFTEGTAGEKIMGAAFKYCEIPKLYGKPLKILIIGGAEKICREQYGCLKSQDIQKCSETKQLFLDFYASHNITFEGATEMLLKTLKEKAETVNMVKIYQKPLLKWVGGKTQILDEVLKHFPSECNNYIEPFIGGGSVLFAILSSNTVNIKGSIIAADKNQALISFYKNLQTNSSKLSSEYKSLVQKYNSLPMPTKKEDEKRKKTEEVAAIDKVSDKSEYYYYYRKKFNDTNDKTTTESSALFLFLNKACFRGLYRTGPNGFNVPFGNYKQIEELSISHFSELAEMIKSVKFICQDFRETLKLVKNDDFVYCDPPYVPINSKSFVGYNEGGFTKKDHEDLFKALHQVKNVKFALSNSESAKTSFDEYKIVSIDAKRAINSKNPGEIAVELLICN